MHKGKNASPTPTIRTRFDANYGEKQGSRDIYPDENGHYTLFEEGDMTVKAAPLQHTIPCVGYVVTESNKPGRLKIETLSTIVERNREALKEQLNIRDGNKAYAALKKVKPGESFKFPGRFRLHFSFYLPPYLM